MFLSDKYYEAEQERLNEQWKVANTKENANAFQQLRRHMPSEIQTFSEAELAAMGSPNGKFLPLAIVKKFKHANVLELLRMDPDHIVKLHPAVLEGRRIIGFTLSERR